MPWKPSTYAIHGGTTEDNYTVTGLALDYDVDHFFFMYGLSLARLNRCTEAIPIFQALLAAVPGDEVAVYNANAGLEICQENIDNPPTETPQEGEDNGNDTGGKHRCSRNRTDRSPTRN